MLYLGVFAVRNFWEEDSVLPLSVKIFLVSRVLKIIHAGTGILLWRKIIILHLVWFKELSLNLAWLKVRVCRSIFYRISLWIIACRTNCVLTKARISWSRKLLGRYRWCSCLRFNHKIIMLVSVVALSNFFKLANIVPFMGWIISSWARIINGRGILKNRWAWCCGTESGNLNINDF